MKEASPLRHEEPIAKLQRGKMAMELCKGHGGEKELGEQGSWIAISAECMVTGRSGRRASKAEMGPGWIVHGAPISVSETELL